MRSLTIVYSLPDDMDASEITLHPCARGYSWSDLMQVRNLLTLQAESLQEHVAPDLYDEAIEEQARLNEKIASLSDQLQDCESELKKERIKFQMAGTTVAAELIENQVKMQQQLNTLANEVRKCKPSKK